jgi:hypothetical protein
MRKKLKLSSEVGNSGNKKYLQGYGGAYGGVWRSLRLTGVWNHGIGFVLVSSAFLVTVAVKKFS